ncbi:DUF3658 domain-containing protein [Nocardia terpenica]|uniref:DUF1835 domain-containing protein n=1 Tax=Nocardia terpenica TaxID=455432 RepID=A0A6G9YWZ1_9NOCA|nr:DUF1835 domain-containing protein [Nocardia terpenica]
MGYTRRRCQLPMGTLAVMGALHLTAGPGALPALRTALDSVGRSDDAVLWFPDTLSCGPLLPPGTATRVQWWDQWPDDDEPNDDRLEEVSVPGGSPAFWKRVEAADPLVLWYDSNDTAESLFFHVLCDKAPDNVPIDVAALHGPVGSRSADELAGHLDTLHRMTAAERAAVRRTWQRLEQENATFRILRDGHLMSAPADHYDTALLDAASSEWTLIIRIVAPVMAATDVGHGILLWRVKSLVDSGALLADGDPWLWQDTNVKRVQPQHP